MAIFALICHTHTPHVCSNDDTLGYYTNERRARDICAKLNSAIDTILTEDQKWGGNSVVISPAAKEIWALVYDEVLKLCPKAVEFCDLKRDQIDDKFGLHTSFSIEEMTEL